MERILAQDRQRLPSWLKRPMGQPTRLHEMKRVLRSRGLHTVCEEARCPNIGECFAKPTATFMIMGRACTRNCGFCSVDKAHSPLALDPMEPENIAITARELGLRHVVVTSVTRDDLLDGGALHFAKTISKVREALPDALIEVLTPDFNGDERALDIVLNASPHIFNHNVETVPSLYPIVRPKADFQRSLDVLKFARSKGAVTKSGFMAGLGETREEVRQLLIMLSEADVDIVTIGQYLRPTLKNLEVKEFISLEVFAEYEVYGKEAGIKEVSSGPFVRSSYNAEKVWKSLRG
ncbi:MAG: lipoyl synthase [Deltaproteobacteria bacterium]|nr:lipoyl synthase [Deltaproteobacteria bacterium]